MQDQREPRHVAWPVSASDKLEVDLGQSVQCPLETAQEPLPLCPIALVELSIPVQ